MSTGRARSPIPRTKRARDVCATRGRLLADLGGALAAAGRTAESQAAYGEAVELAWQPQLFRSVADARLQAGDTLGALPLLARVAVDPSTPDAYADSVRAHRLALR
ncbi:hypothetical protein BH23GEM9_BH23GEM9_03350 [soil metagenome]